MSTCPCGLWAMGSSDRGSSAPISIDPIRTLLHQPAHSPIDRSIQSVHPPLHDCPADPVPRDEVGQEPVPARAVPLQARAEALAGQLHQLLLLQVGAVERLSLG